MISIYMTFWKSQNYRDRKQVSGCQRVRVRGRVEEYEIFEVDGTVVYSDCVGCYIT